MKRTCALALLVALPLVGCSRADDSASATESCRQAMADMKFAYDALPDDATAEQANALELGPLEACASAADWLAAARANPSALGLTETATISADLDLRSRCSDFVPGSAETPVCKDAVALALIS